ncbi:MAG: hypothetical protein HGA90_04995 [Alphaproteobacteria bacterium]|nr:hypothetical protein [Alphaproteobacteria bacterium]
MNNSKTPSPRKWDFPFYENEDGKTVTALLLPSAERAPVHPEYISHEEYINTVTVFNNLHKVYHDFYLDYVKDGASKERPAAPSGYDEAIRKAHLHTERAYIIVADFAHGCTGLTEPVYNVGGYPVRSKNMSNQMVSYYTNPKRNDPSRAQSPFPKNTR